MSILTNTDKIDQKEISRFAKRMIPVFVTVFLFLSWSIGGKFIVSTKVSRRAFHVNYADATTEIFNIQKDGNKRYINLEHKRYYLDVDAVAYPKESIKHALKTNTIRPKYESAYLPIIYMVFFIDDHGEVVAQGIDRAFPDDAYQEEFKRLVSMSKFSFYPAKNDGTKVASVLKISIDYYALF